SPARAGVYVKRPGRGLRRGGVRRVQVTDSSDAGPDPTPYNLRDTGRVGPAGGTFAFAAIPQTFLGPYRAWRARRLTRRGPEPARVCATQPGGGFPRRLSSPEPWQHERARRDGFDGHRARRRRTGRPRRGSRTAPSRAVAGRQSAYVVQYALASRADGLERVAGAGRRDDRRAREHEAVAHDRRDLAVERRDGRAAAEDRASEQTLL